MKQPDAKAADQAWKTLLICPNRGLRGELLPLLAQQSNMALAADLDGFPSRQPLCEMVSREGVNLAFLDMTSDAARGLALIEDLLAIHSSLPVVVLLADQQADLLRCLRAGASEFLVSPFGADQLQAVMGRLARRLNPAGASRGGQGRILCVMPAKGACGASTIACTLAFQWKRLGSQRILLADLDSIAGILGFLLKVKSTYSFVDAISHSVTLDADVWRALVTPFDGVDILLPPDSPVEALGGMRDATALIEFARNHYDTVVLDVGSAYGDWSLSIARQCDELLLVATNELPALQATQRVLGYFDRNRVERSKVRLVINRYSREVGLSREMIETALNAEIYQLIPSDYEAVQRALIEGKLIPSGSLVGKSIARLADQLAGREAAGEPETGKPAGLGGMFNKLLRRNLPA
ncbi:MAG: hypothetical protein HY822_22290 [Acidobacteria bacterium]|nr:hypothetical protein [Acidobacteriota bacterium]